MSEWWTYRLEDFLIFSPRVYWRMFELANAAFWPLHLLTLAAGLAIVLLVLRRPPRHGLWIALVLAALFAFVGWSFLSSRYAVINWAIAYVAPAFGLQALLLAFGGAARGGLAFERRDIAARLGLLIMAAGLVVYPLLPPLFRRPWTSAEVFGIAPDPTAITTLGVLLAASGGPVPLLFAIPLLWLLLSGLTLHAMGDPQACPPLLAAGTTVAALALRRIAR
ncbi:MULTISPECIES: DUF6064 family protein [Mesorhizobium]|uniref:DUF6064 family protein n=1 Tax=Mesorhizobium sp. TaxID=1871066 RepID=UPI000494CC33|nr:MULTISPECIES: DUF6064 family protein [Mesorhizobium]RWM74599.1 MAG: hypothetical protein EOR82_05085 [Mesorhizobium sp.]TIO27931.1 MAG: hypothetical protein E5X83_00510 [Mesorhizobium sp.]TJV63358.1 MAG: hypothetical protein E5X82_05690 [Mesorhizobium sp.]